MSYPDLALLASAKPRRQRTPPVLTPFDPVGYVPKEPRYRYVRGRRRKYTYTPVPPEKRKYRYLLARNLPGDPVLLARVREWQAYGRQTRARKRQDVA